MPKFPKHREYKEGIRYITASNYWKLKNLLNPGEFELTYEELA